MMDVQIMDDSKDEKQLGLAQQLRALTAFVEDLGLVSRVTVTHNHL